MPSGQKINATGFGQPISPMINKPPPPPPNKPPPPPPPPPKSSRVPPPPPRNSSQMHSQSTIPSNQLCTGMTNSGLGGSVILNNGSSMSSLNSAGRCSHTSLIGPNTSGQRSHNKHAESYSSRSSLSSHSAVQHHHHTGVHSTPNNGNNAAAFLHTCGHQNNIACGCSTSVVQYSHANSSSHSDNGSCNLSFSQDNRSCVQVPYTGCCAPNTAHHTHVSPSINNGIHRCGTMQMGPGVSSDQILRPVVINHCSHMHRLNGDNHHHQAGFCNSHIQLNNQQQVVNDCVNCSHFHAEPTNHDCNLNLIASKTYPSELNQHCTQNQIIKSENNNESLLSTAHTHNLSNSSTTTHTSNVAARQPSQFCRPTLSKGTRGNSSQQFEQYGPSSAASTSSATASLSSHHNPGGFEDLVHLYPSNRIRQPVPPPYPVHKSRPASPNQILMSNNGPINNNLRMPIITTTFMNTPETHQQQQQVFTSDMPPLPPKPVSPNASSASTQMTILRTSPVTRVTSQAGVQNPLPSSDVPPPLPPLNPGSRTQLLINPQTNRMPSANDMLCPNPIPDFMKLSLNRDNGMVTEAERKTEALTRQIELELDMQQKSGEPLGICPKCNGKVMPAQEACKAMNQIYHASCFVCCECNRTLLGKIFYPVMDKVYCEEDFKYTGHMQSLEKCAACSQPIFDMILSAMDKSYHPKCFKCCICGQCLDGVLFTSDSENKIYCVRDYHSVHSPKCAACGKLIAPIDGTGETVRVVSMDKDYHIDCYCCKDCGLQLTDEEPSQSYPLDNQLLCRRCHINRLGKRQQQQQQQQQHPPPPPLSLT